MTIVDEIRARAEAAPGHPALRLGDGRGGATTVSYAELVAAAEAHADRLRREGVAPADRCGLLAPQGRRFVELALGVLAAEACLVPIPDDTRGTALDEVVRRAHLQHLVSPDEAALALRSLGPVAPVDGCGDREYRALRPAYLRFTSGTTNRRKGVLLGHGAILERLSAANRALEIGAGDRILWLLPMAHHFVVSILLYLRQGATVLLPADALARTALELAEREAATLVYASPHHYGLLGKDRSEIAMPQLRLAVSTADGLRREIAERFAQRFGLPVSQALGIIEVGLPVANLRSAAAKPEALGRPLPDYDVWLRGEDGERLAAPGSPERPGEICIRGPGLLDAYVDPWLPARELLEPDGFRTGDQGYWDADGDLQLVGRRSNRISMAGMKFFCEEVEAVLDAHPQVLESRVLAREHAHLGQIPVAEIVPRDPARPPERRALAEHCRERLPGYKVPREFRSVERLPHTSSGKLERPR